jgi:tRNA pseudouridine synthase 10
MNYHLKDKKIISIAENVQNKYILCDNCLGRLFAQIEHGFTNEQRGKIIRKNIKKNVNLKNCWLCDGLIKEIKNFSNIIIEKLNDYEFKTFLIGTRIDEDILEREYEITKENQDFYEPIKNELNREIGKIIEKQTNKLVDFKNPDIMILLDTSYDEIYLQIKPLYFYGRYNKYKRNLPQTKWFCRICRGKGCRKCDYTGKMYDTSIEELISKHILHETKGEEVLFHGCGREDIDVLMLGNGRPFIIEIKNPKNRSINLNELQNNINKDNEGTIKVSSLKISNKKEIQRLKSADFKKIYKVVIIGEKPLNKENLKKVVHLLRDKTINQFTPSRVARRRANIVRDRKIYNIKIEESDNNKTTLLIQAQSGTYIKELVTGDDGRTKPSISELIKTPCKVLELDVLEIKGE